MSRRAIMGTAVAAAAGVAVVGSGYQILGPAFDPQRAIARFIVRQVPDVAADDIVATHFADEALEHLKHQFGDNFDKHITVLENPLLTNLLSARQVKHQSDFERTIVTLFMHSTDLLLPQRQGNKVQYIAFADPYARGCSNLLAVFG